jgi:hypothetical protein
MGEPGAPLDLVLALDRAWGELAAELPAHVRAFARAHAAGAPVPPAPAAAGQGALARRALAYPALAARGLALLRLAVPVAVEGEPAVARARAGEPRWSALAALAAARDAASRARFGRGFLELVHALHGAPAAAAAPSAEGRAAAAPVPVPTASLEEWRARSRVIGPAEIDAIWRDLARRHGAAGRLELVPSGAARPRAFVVEPGREVIAVVPARVETSAARFAVLHELGHALAGLIAPEAVPRAVDEAAASYAARAMEAPGHPWHSPLAAEARARRTALAAMLDEVERGAASPPAGVKPPWALWHDPGAQASYVRAEQIADVWAAAPASAGAALAHWIARAAESIDRDALARLGARR